MANWIGKWRAIAKSIRRENGRRRMRTINMHDVATCIRWAKENYNGVYWKSGGMVANAYDYPASTAAVVAVKLRSRIAIRIGTHDAHRSASDVTWYGPASRRDNCIQTWRDKQTAETLKAAGWVILSESEATAIQGRFTEVSA